MSATKSSLVDLPTYTEIARAAGVSTKTICNVVGNPSIVRPRTMERVLETIRKMGVPNVELLKARQRPVRADSQKSILFLVDGLPSGAMSSPVYARILIAAEKQAHKRGWQFIIRHRSLGDSLEESLANFRGQGILLFGRTTSVADVGNVIPDIRCVRLLGTTGADEDCDQVDYDRQEVCRIAARNLMDRGCKILGFIGDRSNSRGVDFLQCAQAMGLRAVDGSVPQLFESDGANQIVSRSALEQAWKIVSQAEIDGLFVYSDQVANAIHPLLMRLGLRPDVDLKLISCNAEELFLSTLHPRPATIDIHSTELGVRAVETLLWRIQNPMAAPTVVVIRPKPFPGDILK